jgi:PhnB protein
MKLSLYVNYPGNCKQALEYYKEHLGAKIERVMTFAQMPPGQGAPPPGLSAESVLHARYTVGGNVVMCSDGPKVEPMRSAYLTLNVDSSPEAERIHKALSSGGEVFMGMEETFFAHRFSMLRDKFGCSWMILHEKPMPQG